MQVEKTYYFETVGVGQGDCVVENADITIVVLVPG